MQPNFKIVQSPLFLLSLFMLITNDLILKELYGNFITGKLSDFAGLYVWALFWISLFPRFKKPLLLGSALLFIFWKSVYSSGFIHFWNTNFGLQINRVIDYWDLTALLVLIPIAIKEPGFTIPRFKLPPVIPIVFCIYAFAATSSQEHLEYEKSEPYFFESNLDTLIFDINDWIKVHEAPTRPLSKHRSNINYWEQFYQDSIGYYVSRIEHHQDTVYTEEGEFDYVMEFDIPIRDSVYLNSDSTCYIPIPLDQYLREDGRYYDGWMDAKIKFEVLPNGINIHLIELIAENFTGIFEGGVDEVEQEKLKENFEAVFIQWLSAKNEHFN